MKVVISAAGTGGHINPGIAIANKIKEKEPKSEIIFIGTNRGLENDLVPRAGYKLKTIEAHGLKKEISFENLKHIIQTIKTLTLKVEIVQIQHPDHSHAALEEMKDHVQSLVEALELPWHILRLCGGDMSFTSAITYDFEVYSAAQKRWLEVSSVSNFESYQANRLKCRYRGADKKTHLCHTLNGSALALPRIVAALLENHQTPEGIRIPKALVPYTGFDMID